MSKVTKCRICKGRKFKRVFSLGKQPLANKFIDPKKDKVREKVYPLVLLQCQGCTLLQLSYVVPKEEMYDEYFYVPSVSKTNLLHFQNIVKKTVKALRLKKGDLVVDIGSNDGSLLSHFKKKGIKVIGVDPARNIKSKVKTVVGYFDRATASLIVRTTGKYAKLVTATNVFAHVDDLYAFIEALDLLLDGDGVFFAQFPDARNLLAQNQFDTIYHEHLSYFTYEPLYALFANTPFELFNITSDNIHGGSMQIWVRRRRSLIPEFVAHSIKIKKTLKKLIVAEKKRGKKIVGFAASAKGTVLLNFCGLDSSLIDYVVDGTKYKQGKMVPGTNIRIYPESHLKKNPPDIILILAWNFEKEILKKLHGRGYECIIPIPKVKLIK